MSDFSSKAKPLDLHVSDPPYENHFFSDSAVSCQCVLASPLPSTDEGSPATHRLLFAWPAGNSGATAFFKVPEGSAIESSIQLRAGRNGRVLDSFKLDPDPTSPSSYPSLGVSGLVEFTHTAELDLAILGSLRTIRDFTEGNGILNPHVQDAIHIFKLDGKRDGISISRALFDGKTTICLTFASIDASKNEKIVVHGARNDSDSWATFATGIYAFEAHVNYAQTHAILANQLLKPPFDNLISSQPDAVKSLSFLCSSDKILAGAWRFLTYFGRDSMISLLLLMPILREGEYGPIEIGLSAVLERIDCMSGSVCHEENIGDYPAAQAALNGREESDAAFDYKMVDTDFFLPILAKQYFIGSFVGQARLASFLRTTATMIPANSGMTYRDLLTRTCQKILDLAWSFARPEGHVSYKNLIALKAEVPVGQWRDSNDGLGGGRYPYDVNTGLMPAALHAIADLAECGTFPDQRWVKIARERAEVWEHQAPLHFIGSIPQKDAKKRLEEYEQRIAFPGASTVDQVKSDMYQPALALNEDGSFVEIMHTDACFRLMLLPKLILSEDRFFVTQHLRTLEHVAWSILTTFPAGLSTPAGVLIANPAYSTNPSHAPQFTTGAYHGIVIWAWNSLIMLTKALEVQLSAISQAEQNGLDPLTRSNVDSYFYNKIIDEVKRAYTKMWDLIEANREHLSAEVWSWRWNEKAKEGKGDFAYVPLSHLPTPDGAGQTESNARQLWSLTFLALERKGELER